MTGDYVLSCESTVDLTPLQLARRDIAYIGYPFQLNGRTYRDDLGQTLSYADFYAALAAGAETATMQINAFEYAEYFEPFLRAGRDVLHLCLSSGITGTINSAMLARENLLEQYPDRKIILVDSLAASSGFGLLMDRLADLRDAGMTMEDLARWAEENKRRVHHWFFSTDLTFYIKGGRISKTAGTVGSVLGICPLMNVSAEGKLVPREKIRSKRRVIRAAVDRMEQYAEAGLRYTGKCYISHSACRSDALQLAGLVEERFPLLRERPAIYDIGTTIGCHSGPGTAALFFWGSPRAD